MVQHFYFESICFIWNLTQNITKRYNNVVRPETQASMGIQGALQHGGSRERYRTDINMSYIHHKYKLWFMKLSSALKSPIRCNITKRFAVDTFLGHGLYIHTYSVQYCVLCRWMVRLCCGLWCYYVHNNTGKKLPSFLFNPPLFMLCI
jgi:hypothetical protein